MPGSFVVQPVQRARTNTPIPPVVARTEDPGDSQASVFAFCVLLNDSGYPIANAVDPATNTEVQSLYSTASTGLHCYASVPTDAREVTRASSSSRGPGRAGSSSSSAASSSSSGTAAAADEGEHMYFAFNELNFSWVGTYCLGADVYTWRPSDQQPTFIERIVSSPIEVTDEDDPQEEPTNGEKRILKRLRTHQNMSHFQLPQD